MQHSTTTNMWHGPAKITPKPTRPAVPTCRLADAKPARRQVSSFLRGTFLHNANRAAKVVADGSRTARDVEVGINKHTHNAAPSRCTYLGHICTCPATLTTVHVPGVSRLPAKSHARSPYQGAEPPMRIQLHGQNRRIPSPLAPSVPLFLPPLSRMHAVHTVHDH